MVSGLNTLQDWLDADDLPESWPADVCRDAWCGYWERKEGLYYWHRPSDHDQEVVDRPKRHRNEVYGERQSQAITAASEGGAARVRTDGRRAWVVKCSCGWVAANGVGVLTFATRKQADALHREHVARPAVSGRDLEQGVTHG